MRKCVLCHMRTTKARRSACASTQSDQHLRCSLPKQNDTSSLYIRNFKILSGLCSWGGQFVSSLVGDSQRHIFSWRGSFLSLSWLQLHKFCRFNTNLEFSLLCFMAIFTLCKAIHVQWNDTWPAVILQNCTCVKQVLIVRKLIFGYKVQQQQIHHKVERFLTNQNSGYKVSPTVYLVENRSTVRCICCRWTLYPKINFQPIRTCLTHAQIFGMTVGHVSFRLIVWSYIP